MTGYDQSKRDADASPAVNTRAKGSAGEERAAEHLLSKGYQIICRNYRSKRGEIDCIARDPDGTLVFVEVKTAYGTSAGNPAFWVTPAKQRALFGMARQYLYEHRIADTPCRFDVIAIAGGKVDHLKNAIVGM